MTTIQRQQTTADMPDINKIHPSEQQLAFPNPNQHTDRVNDIVVLWGIAVRHGFHEGAQKVIGKYPQAKNDPAQSEKAQHELRVLLDQPLSAALPTPSADPFDPFAQYSALQQPAPIEVKLPEHTNEPVPVQTSVQANAPAVPAQPAADSSEDAADDTTDESDESGTDPETHAAEEGETEADETEEDAEESETDDSNADDSDTQTSTPRASASTVVSIPSAGDPTWSSEQLGDGLISQLSRTLAHKETVTLILSRNREELVVTILPTKGEGEAQETALPLSVTGSPRELDKELLSAMPIYQQARKSARDLAQELLDKTNKAVAASKNKAASTGKVSTSASAKPAVKAPAMATVTITTNGNPGALIHLENGQGGRITANSGKPLKIAAGTYTVHAIANMTAPHSEEITVKSGEQKKVEIKLQAQGAPSLF